MSASKDVSLHAAQNPEHLALIFEGRHYTYRELDEVTDRIAAHLRELGVRIGDRVAIVLPNVPEFVVAYLAALRLGAVATSINGALAAQTLQDTLNDCSPRVVFSTPDFAKRIEWNLLRHQPATIGVEGVWDGAIPYEDIAGIDCTERISVNVAPETPASILYSSGTTGIPKGVTLSHGNLAFNAESKVRYCRFGRPDRVMLFVPLFHVYGQNAILGAALCAGSTIVLHRGFDPDTILESIQKNQVTMFFAVPTVYALLINRARDDQLSTVRYWFSAAVPMPIDLLLAWQQKQGVPIHEGYGLTETSPFACYNHESKHKVGSVGTPIRGVEIGIVDPEDRTRFLPAGEAGEIVIRGPNVMLEYWGRPDDTRSAVYDGWFRTGDLGRVDDEGYVFVLDRLKDMINVAGIKVWPIDVENVLAAHPSVREAAVFGRADDMTGERVVAHIVLHEGTRLNEAELREWCLRRLARYQVPVETKFVDELIRNPAGKVLRRMPKEGAGDRP